MPEITSVNFGDTPTNPLATGHRPVNTEWLERYSRQILLKEVGGRGQNRLDQSVVGIVGAGSIGMPLILYLAAAGVGQLVIIDAKQTVDKDLTQNSKKPLDMTMLAEPNKTSGRADAARTAAHFLNPTIKTVASNTTLQPDNASEHMAAWDLTVLASSHPDTRQTVNAAALRLGKPLLGSWRIGNSHYVTASRAGNDSNAPCLFCQEVADVPHKVYATHADVQLSHLAAGVVGSILAMETIKTLLNIGQGLWHTLLEFDPGNATYTHIPTQQNPLCPMCQGQQNA